MIFVFYIFAAALVFFSWKSLRGGFQYRDHFRRELSRPASVYQPFSTIVAPCRGLDEGLEENLEALFKQDFPRWEIIFVVDGESDAAVALIRRLIDRHRTGMSARLVIACKATDESQKVHNLRAGASKADPESEVFVFVDSDARPDRKWVANLVAPLADEKIGAATGYRWFLSEEFGFASELRSVWNASIASALGANQATNFCWGGSTAVRRETFEQIGMDERWRGTLSDDFAMTRALRDNGLGIFFVPAALTASVETCTFRECLEFTTRQIKITRVYAPHLWKMSLIGSSLFNLVWIWGVLNLFLFDPATMPFVITLSSLLLVTAFGIGKAEIRRRAVRSVLAEHESALRKQFWTQNILWLVTPALFLYNGLVAMFSREIVWRGIRYRLDSANKTTVCERPIKTNLPMR